MDNKPSFRTKKIELSIKRLVSEFLVTHRDYLNQFPSLRLEITNVKVSKDLRFAKVFLIHNIAKFYKELQFKNFFLGGGRSSSPEDSLLFFKKGFSSYEKEFKIGYKIYNESKYKELKAKFKISNEKILFYR